MHSIQKNRELLIKAIEEYIEVHGRYDCYPVILEELLNNNKYSLRKAINKVLLHFSSDYKQRYYHTFNHLYHKKITELNNDKFKTKYKEENNEDI